MMKRIALWVFSFMLAAAPALADSQGSATGGTPGTQSTAAGCVYNASQPTLISGQQVTLQCDINGNLRITGGGGGGGGGTSSNFGSAFPTAGTAIGFKDSTGTNMAAGNLDASGNIKVILGSGATTVVTQPTAANLNATVVGTGTFAVQAAQSGTWNINNITGTLSLPTGAATAANQATEIASLATIATNSGSPIPAGTNTIGNVVIVAGTTGGTTPFTLTAANSTNATNVKASAGLVDHISVYNNSATLAWVSFYDNSGTPTCGTAIKYQVMIPANSTSGAGAVEDFAIGVGHASGIGICVTTGIAGTGSVAASAYVINVFYK